MPLMSTAADPLGPGLSGPLPRTLPRRRQGGYVPYTAMNYLCLLYTSFRRADGGFDHAEGVGEVAGVGG